MSAENSASALEREILVFSPRYLWGVIDKQRLDLLPEETTGEVLNATPEFLDAVGMCIDSEQAEAYCCTTENNFFRTRSILTKEARYQGREFTAVNAVPWVWVENLIKYKPKTLYVDYGADDELKLVGEEIPQFEELAFFARIASYESLCVIQDAEGYALSVKIDGEKFALAFFDEEKAQPTLIGYSESTPGARIERNDPEKVAIGVYDSDYAGLVFSRGTAQQRVIRSSRLETLAQVCRVLNGSGGSWLQRLLK